MGPSKFTRNILGPTACVQSTLVIFLFLNAIVIQLTNGQDAASVKGMTPATTLSKNTRGPEQDLIFRVTQNGTDCIRAMFKVNFTVEYACRRGHHGANNPHRRTCRADLGLPDPRQVITRGRCGPEPVLMLTWSDSLLSLTFKFKIENGEWFADHLEFSFDPKDKHFPNASEKKRKILSAEKNLRMFQAPVGQSYFCNATEIVDLGLGASRHAGVELTESQVQVFQLPTTTNFGEVHECPLDNERPRSPITAFVIASCLALLVILIIAGYYVSRRNNPSPYATVD